MNGETENLNNSGITIQQVREPEFRHSELLPKQWLLMEGYSSIMCPNVKVAEIILDIGIF